MKIIKEINALIKSLTNIEDVEARIDMDDNGFDIYINFGKLLPVEDGEKVSAFATTLYNMAKSEGYEIDTPFHYRTDSDTQEKVVLYASFYAFA